MTKFQVGELVEVLNADKIVGADEEGIKTGDVVEVTAIDGFGDPLIKGLHLYNWELEYIRKVEPKPTKNQRISALEKQVAELERKLAEKGVHYDEVASAPSVEELIRLGKSVSSQSNNQKRAAIVEKAKRFVGEREACRKGDEVNQDKENGNQTSRNFWYETEFFVKDAKVTALVYWLQLGKKRTTSPKEIGRSKCHPNDCFNEYIGKAIALGRALGLDVSEFEQAVQPDEVVVGMEVEYRYKKDNEYAFKCNVDHLAEVKTANRDFKGLDKFYSTTITNDTNAQYEEAQVHESNKAF